MPIVVTPEVGIPFPFDTTPEEIDGFREKAHALFETVQELVLEGASVDITDEDKAQSHQIASSGKFPPVKNLTPGTIVNLEAILSEWDQEVLDVGRRLRNYITNKLIMESVDPDPRQRMKALENLGKISNVGLFSDRLEVSVTNRSIDSIENELQKTLELYMGEVEQAPTELDLIQKTIADIDIDAELGTKTEIQAKDAELDDES
jgi:DNA topoisomerase VI subunit B